MPTIAVLLLVVPVDDIPRDFPQSVCFGAEVPDTGERLVQQFLRLVFGGLHAEQHYEYHRHLKPGDVLTATTKPGKEWEKEGKRAGKLKFKESVTEYRDQNGELVITARSIGVQTERPATSG